MARPIITLTTDFGLSDHYAGTMKGVILRICPNAQIVDISHEVTPYEIAEGAYTIAQMFPYNGRPLPAVVLVKEGGRVELIRRRDSYENLLTNEIW